MLEIVCCPKLFGTESAQWQSYLLQIASIEMISVLDQLVIFRGLPLFTAI